MKKIAKLLIVVLIITTATESFAQRFGVIAGMNFSNMLMKDDDDSYSVDNKMKPGFHVGATLQVPSSGLISFETGILFTTKGFKIKEDETYQGETYKYKATLNLFYIDVPLLAKFSFEVSDVIIYGAVGPYLGVGLTGKTKTKVTYQDEKETESQNIEWGSDEEDMLKRFDFGLCFGAGVEITEAILVGVSYDLGLANISSYTDEGTTIKNRVLKISFGYKFGGK